MAEDKKATFSIRPGIDTSEFDKGMADIQRKLRNLQQESRRAENITKTLGADPVLGPAAKKYFDPQAELQSLRQKDQELTKEFQKEQNRLNQKMARVKELVGLEGELSKKQQERLDQLKAETAEIEKQQKLRVAEAGGVRQARMDMGDTTVPGMPEQPGKPGVGSTIMGVGRSMLGGIGAAGLVQGISNAIVTGIGDIISRDRVISQARGGALRGGVNQDIRAQYQGRGSEAFFFAEERAQAMRMAQSEAEGERVKTGVGTLGSIGAGMAGGAVAGSFFGGIGAIPGAVIGGGLALGARMVGSSRARNQIFDPTRFGAELNEEAMQRYNANLGALKEQNINKTLAGEEFFGRTRQMSQLERSLGINTRTLVGDAEQQFDASSIMNLPAGQSMYGGGKSFSELQREGQARVEQANAGRQRGLLQTQMDVGLRMGGLAFEEDVVQERMQGILGAGGTTSAARGLAGVSEGMRRQFDLGNADQLVGRITGQAGMEAGQTEDQMKRFLAEAQAAGIELSGMPKELERFTEMSSKLITAGGGVASGAGELAAAALIGTDASAISAAGGATQRFMRRGKQAGGFEGQMGMGFLQGDLSEFGFKGKLDSDQINLLNQTSYGEARDEDFLAIGESLDISPEQAEDLLRQKDLFKQTRTGRERDAIGELGSFMKEQGFTSVEEAENAEGDIGKRSRELLMKVRETRAASMGTQFTGMSGDEQRADINQLARLSAGFEVPKELDMSGVNAQLQAPGSTSEQDRGARAESDKVRLDNLANNLDSLAEAAKKHAEEADIFTLQMQKFNEALSKANDSGALSTLADDLESIRDSIQRNRQSGGNIPSGAPGD